MARILEQGPAVAATVTEDFRHWKIQSWAAVGKIKANDTRFANRGNRMSGVHAATGTARASRWMPATVGRGSRIATEQAHNGTNTPVKGPKGNYRPK